MNNMEKKVGILCTTIKSISMNGNNLLIDFRDGSQRKYNNGIEYYNKMKKINGFKSVGSYYRKNIRDKNVPYIETIFSQNSKKINK